MAHRHATGLMLATFLTVATSVEASAAPGEPIGATLSVINVVTAEFERDTRTLQTGDNVRQDELIDVSKDGSTELKLNDDTKLALGAGARMRLDKFVYDPDKSSGAIGLNLVEGAFRFITGIASKPSYVVKVPRASITVRGTIFDAYVLPDETSYVLLHEGAVTVCNERGDCQDHDEPGKLIRVDDQGDVSEPLRWASLDDDGALPFDIAFPFVVAPPSIDPTPLFSRDDIIKADKQDKPARKTKRAKKTEKTPPKKKAAKTPEPTPAKKKVVKTTPPPKVKKPKPTQKASNDEAVKKAIGAAIGIGIGIGIGKAIGKGGGGGGKPKNPGKPPGRGGGGHGDYQ